MGGPRDRREVDVGNPTRIFRAISSGDYEGARRIVERHPEEASIWVSRRDSDGGIAWKYLPIHLVCLQHSEPPLELIRALLHHNQSAAASTTPHDGNLPMHYICEGGCVDEEVFWTLLSVFPESLEVKNHLNKTPLVMCQPRSRAVLMKVLKKRQTRASLGERQGKKKRDNGRRKQIRIVANDAECENRQEYESTDRGDRDSSQLRQPPKTTPARLAAHRRRLNTFVDTSHEPRIGDDRQFEMTEATPKRANLRSRKAGGVGPALFSAQPPVVTVTSTSSSHDNSTTTASSYLSYKTNEFAHAALSYLYPSYADPKDENPNEVLEDEVGDLRNENVRQQKIIEELSEKLKQSSPDNIAERLMAKAEEDKVELRTRMRLLEEENAKCKEETEVFLNDVKSLLCKKAEMLGMSLFDDEPTPTTARVQTVEALRTVLTHMDERHDNLRAKTAKLETELCNAQVSQKKCQSKVHILQGEKENQIKAQHGLERKVTILEEEKETVQSGLASLKDRVCSLTVINQNLQEQVDSMSESNVRRENDQFRLELKRLHVQLTQMKDDKEEAEKTEYNQQQAAEVAQRIEALVAERKTLQERCRQMKGTILSNNEKHSTTMSDLAAKYDKLERYNAELRRRLTCSRSSSASELKVSLDQEVEGNKLLYEV